jgi:hypothetical protein
MWSHTKNKKKNEEVDVWVVTQEGKRQEKTLSMVKAQVKIQMEKIRKAPHPPPKFDVSQQKQFLHDAQRALEEERVHARSCNA